MTDPTIEVLWKNVLDRWDDEAAHGIFLQHCQETEQLAEAAARYAGVRGDASRGERASKKIAAVTLLATSTLLASRTEPVRGPPRWLTAAVVAICCAAAGYVTLRAMR